MKPSSSSLSLGASACNSGASQCWGQLLRDVERSPFFTFSIFRHDSLKDKSIGRRLLGSSNHDERGRDKASREAGIGCITA